MGRWFGRKSAPEPVRALVPAWLSASGGEGFARGAVGTQMLVKSSGVLASYGASGWELGILRGSSVVIGGTQVVGPQADAIADATGGTTVDFEARSTLGAILAVLRQHGLISQ